MAVDGSQPPEQRRLRPGVMLGFLAHAIGSARFPARSHEQAWEGSAFYVQNAVGERGSIAWQGERFVAAFFTPGSLRNPFTNRAAYRLAPLLAGLPVDLLPLAYQEALVGLLDDYRGEEQPIITAAFWGDAKSERMQAAEPWPDVLEHGASLVQRQFLSPEEALDEWRRDYALHGDEIAVVQAIFARWQAAPRQPLVLSADERRVVRIAAETEAGWEAACESFGQLGIELD